MDVSPKQLVSVSASLIPFLEHDDANRALMGSNMQRQAVPLLLHRAARGGHRHRAQGGAWTPASASSPATAARWCASRPTRSSIAQRDWAAWTTTSCSKFQRSNQNTCINQKPIVDGGPEGRGGRGAGRRAGHRATASWPWARTCWWPSCPGAATTSRTPSCSASALVKDDVYTSIHIEEFEIDARDTKLGKEEITRDIPNVSEDALAKLDENGLVYIGAEVEPGDILVGKVTPKGETELTSEEKLLRAIFGEKAGDVRDASLKVPPGTEGTVIDIKVFSRKERGGRTDRQDKQTHRR